MAQEFLAYVSLVDLATLVSDDQQVVRIVYDRQQVLKTLDTIERQFAEINQELATGTPIIGPREAPHSLTAVNEQSLHDLGQVIMSRTQEHTQVLIDQDVPTC